MTAKQSGPRVVIWCKGQQAESLVNRVGQGVDSVSGGFLTSSVLFDIANKHWWRPGQGHLPPVGA